MSTIQIEISFDVLEYLIKIKYFKSFMVEIGVRQLI